MSLAAILNPSAPPTGKLPPSTSTSTMASTSATVPFHHQQTYISLNRMLIRYQHILLNQPPSDTLSPIQQQVQSDLRSPLPYHRTKWLHNIEHARTLLLQLETTAQSIKVQGAKRAAVTDLAEKRAVIKRLRRYVEDIGREVDSMGEEKWDAGDGGEHRGETVEEILGRPPLSQHVEGAAQNAQRSSQNTNTDLKDNSTITTIEGPSSSSSSPPSVTSPRDELFSSTRRRRGASPSKQDTSTTSGFSNLESTEKTLLTSSRDHESLTTSLLSLTVQLKQQSQAFAATLAGGDKDLLSRALDGLDRNVSSMSLASKNMAFLTRMSEGQGFFGRLKLYAMIVAMWFAVILLVFAMPKLRF